MTHKAVTFTLCAMLLAGSIPVHALGIPTLDSTTALILVSNAVDQAKQAMDALSTAKDAIQKAEQQYNNYKSMVSGNDQLGGFLDNPSLNHVLPMGEWSDIYSSVQDIASLRNQYGLTSADPSVQARFDRMLATTDALQRTYNASTERVRNAEQLRAKLNEVQTPQQKADLQLRYQQETLELQNQQMRLENIKMLTDQQEELENTKRGQNFEDYMMGKTQTLPSYDQ